MSIHIRPGILGFAVLKENVGGEFVELGTDLEQRIFRQMFERELALTNVPRIRAPQHGVPVARHYLQVQGTKTSN